MEQFQEAESSDFSVASNDGGDLNFKPEQASGITESAKRHGCPNHGDIHCEEKMFHLRDRDGNYMQYSFNQVECPRLEADGQGPLICGDIQSKTGEQIECLLQGKPLDPENLSNSVVFAIYPQQ